jgi:hypothetical protein
MKRSENPLLRQMADLVTGVTEQKLTLQVIQALLAAQGGQARYSCKVAGMVF